LNPVSTMNFKTTLSTLALACASLGAQAAWDTRGDVLQTPTMLTLTTAYTGAGDPDTPFNLSGTPAVEIALVESALGLPAYVLDLQAGEQYGTEGSVAWQTLTVAAGDTLSFDWSFSTLETDYEDHAFVVLGGSVTTLATRTQGGGAGSFSQVFGSAGTVLFGLGVIDTVDYLGVSTLAVTGLTVTPVPEPGTWALWMAGAAALVGGRRLHRR
jgi:hypothetical protein